VEWTFIFLMVVLKIPIVGLFWIVWWAVRATPDPEPEGNGGGGSHDRPHPPGRRPPHRPRRGPHGDPALPAPPRARPVRAEARSIDGR
jgi:hypothetical protein